MRAKTKKWFSPLFVLTLAVAGIFGVSAAVVNKQAEETPVVEKADAAGTDVYFKAKWTGATITTVKVHYWNGGDFWKEMTEVYTDNGSKVYKYTIPSGNTQFQYQTYTSNWGSGEWHTSVNKNVSNNLLCWPAEGWDGNNFTLNTGTAYPYTINYYGNGNTSGSMSSVTAYGNVQWGLTANAFVKTGYSFVNWNTNTGGTGTPYSDQALLPTKTNTTTLNLYAQWSQNKVVTMYFDATPLNIGGYTPYMCYSNDDFASEEWVEGTLVDSSKSSKFWYFPTKTAVNILNLKYYFNYNSGAWRSLAVQYGDGWNLAYPKASSNQYTDSYVSDGSILSVVFYKRIDGVDSPSPSRTDYLFDGLSYNLSAPDDVLGSESNHNLASNYLDDEGNTVEPGWKSTLHDGLTLYGIYTWTRTIFVCNSASATSGTTYGLEKNTDSEYISATVVRIEKGQYIRRTDGNEIKPSYYVGGVDSDFSTSGEGTAVLCNKTGAYTIKNRIGDYSNWNDIYIERNNEETALFLAKIFNDIIRPICVDIEGGTKSLSNLQSVWYSNTGSDIYKHFYGQSNTIMNYFKNATANVGGTELEQAAARYDKIERNYGVTALPNFFGRNATSYKPAIVGFSPLGLFGDENEDNGTTILIIVASSISILSITALSVLMVKKKKSANK